MSGDRTERTDVAFLAGGGEMGARMRAFDWSSTPLGPPARWPQSLKTAVRITLTSRQAMFVWWGDTLVNLYNDAYKAIVGGKHPAALGQPASVVWREIWDQVAPRVRTAMREDEGTYDESLLLIMERYGYREETYYTFSYSPVPNDEGGTGGIICANTDDTRRIVGERQLALLRELAAGAANARTVDEACARSAAALGTNRWDLPFAMLYQLDGERVPRLAGTSGIDSDHPAVDMKAGWPFADALATRTTCVVPTLEGFADLPTGSWAEPPQRAAVMPIGTVGLLVVGLSPFRAFDDDYRGFLELAAGQIAATIANAKAYEDERTRAEALATLDRAKTAFFSNVSHEFRTPLTLMLGPIEELLAVADDPEQRETLELLQRNATRLQKLVNALLDFSRLEAGRLRVHRVPTDLASYTADLASAFRSACDQAGLELVVDCPRFPVPANVDRDMWEKIVLNLLSNAFKFTFTGAITVRLRVLDEAVTLTVTDTGTGIADDQLPHVFERFHRVDGAKARTHEGTGIGLALVQELTRLHGGDVRVDSALGEGTMFTVTIPIGDRFLADVDPTLPGTITATSITAASTANEAMRWLAPAHVVSSSSDGPRPRVLLADDNADMRDYVVRLLGAGYDVETVADGETAMAAARARPPDLILSDVMMPRLDGMALVRALRDDARTRSIPIILLSARAGEEARLAGLETGADDYLVKPFSARELLVRVTTCLELAAIRRHAEEALRESEARFRHMADHAPMMVWVTDPNGSTVFLSRSWYDFTGLSPDGALGFGWVEALHPEDRTRVTEAFVRANARREPMRLEYRLRRRDGEYAWALDAAQPHVAADGRFLGYIGSVIDISDRRRAEEALRDADRRKDEFLATLAHELRNPLAPIRNAIGILRSAPGADTDRVHEMMERQVGHMVRLVDDLLEVSRITRGNIELRKELVELSSVIATAVETSRPLIESGQHTLEVSLPSEPLLLDADAVRLAQVFANLLNNAAKYTGRAGHIWLTARSDDETVVVAVRDDGVGIPVDLLPTVFDVFMQVRRSLDAAQGGLGIGLTLVRRLVEMHGGRVDAHSDGPGRGSEFVVRLPIAASMGARVVVANGGRALRTGPLRRVLVVDDNADAAESLAMLLDVGGMETRVAHDGRAALEALRTFRADVVLLDLGMPGMDGYEVARRIRAQPDLAGIRLVALTGWGQPEDRLRSQKAGFDHHVVKPVDIETLQTLVSA